MRGQEMRPKKVLFSIGITIWGNEYAAKEGYFCTYRGYYYTI